jgi:cysteine desulfurase
MTERVYLDHNATSPLSPRVREAMIEAMAVGGNPSSVHADGRRAKGVVEAARERIAALLGAEASDVTFTGSGTEANNAALSPGLVAKTDTDRARALCFVSAVEHPSVLCGGRFAPAQVRQIPVNESGVVDLDAFIAVLRDNGIGRAGVGGANPPFIVSVMLANNETGAVQPVTEIAGLVLERGGLMHCDAVQALGRMPFDLASLGVDLLTIAPHKIGGPKGIGALVGPGVDNLLNDPLIRGGRQEFGRRAGTENVAAIHGFGVAVEAACDELADREMLRFLRDRLESRLQAVFDNLIVFSEDTDRLDNTSLIAIPGLPAANLVIALDLDGIAISSGAACTSGKVGASHVLAAMGVSADIARCAFRVSLGPTNWLVDIDRVVGAIETYAAQHNRAPVKG